MKQLQVAPVIYEYSKFKDFADEFQLGASDLVLTNEYIYDPFMKGLNLACPAVFQEKYGAGEPSDTMVQAIMDEVAKYDIKRIVAVGGGTIIDIAKILCLGGADDLYGLYDNVENLTKKYELLIIPTTCGTGSEVTNISIVNLTKIETKKGLVSPKMFADAAVLIPEFMKTLPYYVFATSSIDALIHAIEGYINPRATVFSDMFGEFAMKEILNGYKQMAEKGEDERFNLGAEFLRASTAAGIAFGNSSCATVHAMSYALGGKYHVAHGESNYQFLIPVLKTYQRKAPGGKLARLEALIGGILGVDAGKAVDALEALLQKILPKKAMNEYGVTQEDIAPFAKSTVDNQQRLLGGSYIPLSQEEIQAIYQGCL